MKTLLIAIAIALLATGCESTKKTDGQKSSAVTSENWNSQMGQLESGLTDLLPYLVDPQQYNDPKNYKKIESSVKRLADLSQKVEHSPSMVARDPSVRFISSAFSEDLKRAQDSLMAGRREFARYSLMNVTAYCIECHTRSSSGPQFDSAELTQTLGKLNHLERGEFLLAGRRYEAALSEFKKAIQQKLDRGQDFFGVDKAVRYALAVTVKVDKSPEKSLQVIELIEKNSNTPFYLKQNVLGWKKALLEWKNEKPVKRDNPQQVLTLVKSLIRKADQASVGSFDKSGEIYYLRALSDLHLLMLTDLKQDSLGEVLYLTGLSYESVRDLSVWSLHENYYESCIRAVPQSKWAKLCYQKLEESVYFGYTGSSGVRVPMDVMVRLQELQKLAF
jgi:hypothetical protein